MRTRPAARWTEPSRTCEQPRLPAASAFCSPRNWKLDVRPITLSFAPRDRRWMISSLTPSEKNCISGSLDRLSKASTAISGSAEAASVASTAPPSSAR
jgi:hypothetical protein